jgi:YVTN family beta-propeller protein
VWRLAVIAVALPLAACASPFTSSGAVAASVPGYHQIQDIPLPGGTGRWDYQALDPSTHRLYIAHLGANDVVVFDTSQQKVIDVVKGIKSPHGLAVAPGAGRLFVTATGSNELVALDLITLSVVGRAAAGDYPDGVDYVPGLGKVYVTDEHGTGDTIVDAGTMRPRGSISLGSDIGNTKYAPESQLVFVAVGGSNELVAIDPQSDRIARRFALPGCEGAHGLQLVASAGRAYVGCEGNGKVVAYDLAGNRVLGSVGVGATPDVMAYDPGLQRIYVASEDGQLAVIQAGDPIRKLAQGNAGPNAHTVAVDPSTHFVYLPLTDVGGHPVLRVLAP